MHGAIIRVHGHELFPAAACEDKILVIGTRCAALGDTPGVVRLNPSQVRPLLLVVDLDVGRIVVVHRTSFLAPHQEGQYYRGQHRPPT
jgi:hypothetical protein